MRCPHCGACSHYSEVPISESTFEPVCPRCGKTCSFEDCEEER